MKKLWSLIAIIAITLTATAQVKREMQPRKEGMQKHMSHGMKQQRRHMLKELALSDAQRSQLKTNHEEYKKKLEQLEENQNMTLKEYNAKKDALNKEQKEKMQALLTPEQKTKMSEIKEREEKQHAEMAGKHLEEMKTKLSLSDDQVIKLKAENESVQAGMKAIRENESLGSVEKKKQMKALMKASKEKRKAIFTPDQLKKMEEMKHHKKKQKPAAI